MPINILIINGACGQVDGNTSHLLDIAADNLSSLAKTTRLDLANKVKSSVMEELFQQADGFIFGTGTYWDSWGSPLQGFLENMTVTEGSELWLGKPAGVIVTMHSVGGKGVLSRLQGVLNTFGVLIPPMSGMVYSAANQMALKNDSSQLAQDLWHPEDIGVICHNLIQACSGTDDWKAWASDGTDFDRLWIGE